MDCKNYNKQLYQYLEGELSENVAMQLEEHLTKCRSCENALIHLQRISQLIVEEKNQFTPDPFMSARIISKLTKSEHKIEKPKYTLRYLSITTLAAAGILIGILVGSLFASNTSFLEDTNLTSASSSAFDQLADEYMPEVDNNPYNLVITENEIPTKP